MQTAPDDTDTELTDSVSSYTGAPRTEDVDTPADDADTTTDAAAAAEAEVDAAADAAQAAGKGSYIPKARLNEVIAQRNELSNRLAALEAAEQARADAAAAAAAEAAAAQAEPPQPARDFDTEREAIEQRYDDGSIDDGEKRKLLAAVYTEEKQYIKDEAIRGALDMFDKRNAEQAAKQSDADFTAARTAFFADEANAAYTTDSVRIAALNEAVKQVYQQHNGAITFADLLVAARDRVEDSFGGKAKPTTETTAERVARERRLAAAKAGAVASSLPGRPDGGVGARGTHGTKDIDDMSTSEYDKLPQAERDRLLGRSA